MREHGASLGTVPPQCICRSVHQGPPRDFRAWCVPNLRQAIALARISHTTLALSDDIAECFFKSTHNERYRGVWRRAGFRDLSGLTAISRGMVSVGLGVGAALLRVAAPRVRRANPAHSPQH